MACEENEELSEVYRESTGREELILTLGTADGSRKSKEATMVVNGSDGSSGRRLIRSSIL